LSFSHEEVQVESCTLMEYIYFPKTIFDFAHLIGLDVYLLLHLTTLHSNPESSSFSLHKQEQGTTFRVKFWEMWFGIAVFTAKIFCGTCCRMN